MFNLLPIYPLDGGKILWHLLSAVSVQNRISILRAVEFALIIALIILVYINQIIVLLPVIFILIYFAVRKFPCKDDILAVQ